MDAVGGSAGRAQNLAYISLEIVRRTQNLRRGLGPERRKKELKMTTMNMVRETTRNHWIFNTPGVMGQIKSYIARSQAERQLRQLDDRLLADIGLKRADISKKVWGH
jgi:uncharacterized protein YjiS (DUF1127 family)